MLERRLIEDRSEVMLGVTVKYFINGYVERGKIISFLQTSPVI